MRSKLTRIATLFVGIICVCLSVAIVQADNCDSKCRERYFFYHCMSKDYFKYKREDCGRCVLPPGGTAYGTCEKNTPALGEDGSKCISSGTNFEKSYTNGTQNCDCVGGDHIWVEAGTETIPLDGDMVTRRVCESVVSSD